MSFYIELLCYQFYIVLFLPWPIVLLLKHIFMYFANCGFQRWSLAAFYTHCVVAAVSLCVKPRASGPARDNVESRKLPPRNLTAQYQLECSALEHITPILCSTLPLEGLLEIYELILSSWWLIIICEKMTWVWCLW